MDSGLWYKESTNGTHAVFVSEDVKERVMDEYHNSTLTGHLGIDKTTDLIH